MLSEFESYLKDVKLAVVASCSDGKPWTATVFFSYDNDLNFYFVSALDRRHSKEILKNPNVSLAIASHKFNLGDEVKGLQIEGECVKLKGIASGKAFLLFAKRFPKIVTKITKKEIVTEAYNSRMWKITPTKIKIFDETKYGSVGKEFEIK